MGRKKGSKNAKKTENLPLISDTEISNLQQNVISELDSNPEYSLDVDPTDKYSLNDQQRRFILGYVDFKDIKAASQYAGIEVEDGLDLYKTWPIQQEIRRINRALYQRQFQTKMLTLDDIGSYLSSMIVGENVVYADNLKPKDKLKAIDTLIDLIKYKQQSLSNPNIIMNNDIDLQIKNLSIDTIQQLINASTNKNPKLNKQGLLPEEKTFLSSLSSNELLNVINDINNEGGENNE